MPHSRLGRGFLAPSVDFLPVFRTGSFNFRRFWKTLSSAARPLPNGQAPLAAPSLDCIADYRPSTLLSISLSFSFDFPLIRPFGRTMPSPESTIAMLTKFARSAAAFEKYEHISVFSAMRESHASNRGHGCLSRQPSLGCRLWLTELPLVRTRHTGA